MTDAIDLPEITPGMNPNSVFGGIPMMSREQAASQDLGIEIPTHWVPLPSRGRVYPKNHPLHGLEKVEIKAMTVREEDLLMSTPLIQKGTVITELVRSCLLQKNLPVEDLLSGDRNALMVAIRITGYGAEYQIPVKCANDACGFLTENAQIDLGDLPLRFLELDPVRPGENRFGFTLPVSKKHVEFKFLTVGEEEEILHEMEKRRKSGNLNQQAVSTRLSHNLVSVDGNESRNLIMKFCTVMAARDSLALRRYIDQHEPTMEMKTEFTCQSCSETKEVSVPFGVGFFWPGISQQSSSD